MVVLLAVMAALVAVVAASVPASAHDHRIPQTVLKKSAKELQAGTRVAGSNWIHPADGGPCAENNTLYG